MCVTLGVVAPLEAADDDRGRAAVGLTGDEVGRGRQLVDDVLDGDAQFPPLAVRLAAVVPSGREPVPADRDAALAVSERSPTGVGDDDTVGWQLGANPCRRLRRATRQQEDVRVGDVRPVDPGVDADVTEP